MLVYLSYLSASCSSGLSRNCAALSLCPFWRWRVLAFASFGILWHPLSCGRYMALAVVGFLGKMSTVLVRRSLSRLASPPVRLVSTSAPCRRAGYCCTVFLAGQQWRRRMEEDQGNTAKCEIPAAPLLSPSLILSTTRYSVLALFPFLLAPLASGPIPPPVADGRVVDTRKKAREKKKIKKKGNKEKKEIDKKKRKDEQNEDSGLGLCAPRQPSRRNLMQGASLR